MNIARKIMDAKWRHVKTYVYTCEQCSKRCIQAGKRKRKFCNDRCKNNHKSQRWKLKQRAKGLCSICGKQPMTKGGRCVQCYKRHTTIKAR